MKTIILKSLSLVNFKGIRNLTVNFDKETSIAGANATGKTTLMDAFTFLLFGKDSNDRKDFNIKTLDKDNVAYAKLDHEVTGVLSINDHDLTLKRCLREKWQKKRGSEDEEFTGHETLFFVDDVPYKSGEYSEKINSIIDESVFKMITNPHYFNSLKWENRRAVLITMAGEISDVDIIASDAKFKDLMSYLEGRSYEKFKEMIAARKKKLKDDISVYPARIDEAQRSIPQEPDYIVLNKELAELAANQKTIDEQIGDILKQQQEIFRNERERQSFIFGLRTELKNIEHEITEKANAGVRERDSNLRKFNDQLLEVRQSLKRHEESYKSNELKSEYVGKQIDGKRADWNTENDKVLTFDESKFTCPTCKRAYEPSDVDAQKETMLSNFNKAKLEKCGQIKAEGLELTQQLQKIKDENILHHNKIVELSDKETELLKEIESLSTKTIESVQIDFNSDPVYQTKLNQIAELEKQVFTAPDNADLKEQKAALQTRIDEIKLQLSVKEQADNQRNRVAELTKELRSYSQQLADLEKQEFVADDFNRTKMSIVESRVNGMFKYVRFKMFNVLINGGIEPTCETLIDGVPWGDANSAGRIQGGSDIINSLCEFYQTWAPVWFDNAESTNDFIPMQSQIIKLIVTKDKKLKVSTAEVEKSQAVEA